MTEAAACAQADVPGSHPSTGDLHIKRAASAYGDSWRSPRPELQSLIIGLGTAGRDLHLGCLHKLRRNLVDAGIMAAAPPWAVDPLVGQEGLLRDTAIVVRRLEEVHDLDPGFTVVHVCTPPTNRVSLFYELAKAGYRRIICEKPLAMTTEEALAIAEIVRDNSMEVAVGCVWLASELTGRLKMLLAQGELGTLEHVSIVQDKPRFTRTVQRPSHRSAFDVELPHSVGLAMLLAGSDATVESAHCTDMELDHLLVPHMGGASVTLRHAGGVTTTIRSDLTSPVRRRSIQLQFARGRVEGHYPISRDDGYAQLVVHGPSGPPRRSVFADEPLTRFLSDCYRWFTGVGDPPDSSLELNILIVAALMRAKQVAGVISDEMASSDDIRADRAQTATVIPMRPDAATTRHGGAEAAP